MQSKAFTFSLCPAGDASDTAIRPKMKAATPSTPLARSKSVQPTSARKHPSSGPLSSPPTKKHKPASQTPTKVKQIVKDPIHQPAVPKQPVLPKQPSLPKQLSVPRPPAAVPAQPAAAVRPPAPQAPPRPPVPGSNALKTPKKQAAGNTTPSTSPDKATAALPLVFKGPGVVQPPQMSSTKARAPSAEPPAGPANVLQIAPLHLKNDLLVPGAQQQSIGGPSPRPQPPAARSSPSQDVPTRAPLPQAAARLPPPPVKREAAKPQAPTGLPPVPPTQSQPAAATPHPASKLSPGRVPKREQSPAKVEKLGVKAEKPASNDKSPGKAQQPREKAERSPAKAERSPVKAARTHAKAEPSSKAARESGEQVRAALPSSHMCCSLLRMYHASLSECHKGTPWKACIQQFLYVLVHVQREARPGTGLPPNPSRAAARSPQARSPQELTQQVAAMVTCPCPLHFHCQKARELEQPCRVHGAWHGVGREPHVLMHVTQAVSSCDISRHSCMPTTAVTIVCWQCSDA